CRWWLTRRTRRPRSSVFTRRSDWVVNDEAGGAGCNGGGRADHAPRARGAWVPRGGDRAAGVRAIRGPATGVARPRVARPAARSGRVPRVPARAVLRGCGAQQGVGAGRGGGGRRRRGQLVGVAHGPRGPAGGA